MRALQFSLQSILTMTILITITWASIFIHSACTILNPINVNKHHVSIVYNTTAQQHPEILLTYRISNNATSGHSYCIIFNWRSIHQKSRLLVRISVIFYLHAKFWIVFGLFLVIILLYTDGADIKTLNYFFHHWSYYNNNNYNFFVYNPNSTSHIIIKHVEFFS